MGLSQRDQTKHNTLFRLGTQSVKIGRKVPAAKLGKFQGIKNFFLNIL